MLHLCEPFRGLLSHCDLLVFVFQKQTHPELPQILSLASEAVQLHIVERWLSSKVGLLASLVEDAVL